MYVNYKSFVWKRDCHFVIYCDPSFGLELSFFCVRRNIILLSRSGICFRHYFF